MVSTPGGMPNQVRCQTRELRFQVERQKWVDQCRKVSRCLRMGMFFFFLINGMIDDDN